MKRDLLGSLSVLAAIAVAMTISTGWRICAESRQSTARHADAAIVLGAAAWGDEPSPVFRERINHAVWLYQSQQVAHIIFTGGQGHPGEPPEAVVAQRYAAQQDVPLEDTWVETASWTTRQNLIYAHWVAEAHGVDTFLLVSDPLHMRRALLIAQDLGMDAYPSPTPTTMYRTRATQTHMLLRETRLCLSYAWRRPYLVQWRL